MPAARTFVLLALATLAGIVGVLAPSLAWAALAFDGLLVAAFLLDLRRAARTPLEASRTWPPLLVQGVDAEISVRLSTASERPFELALRDTLHPGLAESPRRERARLAAGGRGEWKLVIRPSRRGEHMAGPLMARILGPWGLAWSQRQLLPGEPRKVFPQIRWEGKVGHLLLLAHRRSLGHNPQRLRGVGSEPYALREYLPGDPLGKIHWKATARHGRLVSREETWERGARLIVLLDCGRGMSGMDGTRSKLDHALAASLALTRVAVSRGDRVTLVAFSDRVERTVRLHGSPRSLAEAYGAFYDLRSRRSEPAFDLAAEQAVQLESRRSTTILFTSLVDLAAAELLRRALLRLERRHRPILINLEDPELVALALGRPSKPEDAFAKVSGLDILLANRRLGSELRHAGIRVVTTSADRLALEALESYLAMFGQGAAGRRAG